MDPLPAPGLTVHGAEEVPLKAPSLMSDASGFVYRLESREDEPDLAERIEALLGRDEILVERRRHGTTKRGRPKAAKSVDLRPMLVELRGVASETGGCAVELETRVMGGRSVRPKELAELLGIDPERITMVSPSSTRK